MDVVYILKCEDFNYDLAYSLRSLYANVEGYDNVWTVGYTPSWISPTVQRISTVQQSTKWRNALNNILAACENPDISKDFVLFNDDFFAIDRVNLKTDLYRAKGTLDAAIDRYKHGKLSTWKKSFIEVKNLLVKLGSVHFMDFTLHIPMLINKDRFLHLFNIPEVQEHLKKYNSVSYRNLYSNMFYTEPLTCNDCKLRKNMDATDMQLRGQWLSVRDNVTNRLNRYPKLATVLTSFSKCPYERRSII